MRTDTFISLPPMIERFELKFNIPGAMVGPISEYASIYCSMDSHSKDSQDGFYHVNSLYFDSPNHLFLRKRLDGSANRFNVRVRSYGDRGKLPHFLEIKQKKVQVVRKFRVGVLDPSWRQAWETPGAKRLPDSELIGPRTNLDLFLRTILAFQAGPKVLLQYRRKAYVSQVDIYARVTFDTDLKYHATSEYAPNISPGALVPCDHEAIFDPACHVILELKCPCPHVPMWMLDMIRRFDLRRRRFSKYVTAMREVFDEYRCGAFTRQPCYHF